MPISPKKQGIQPVTAKNSMALIVAILQAHAVCLYQFRNKVGAILGDNCYKIRMAIAYKGKGKSGGARVIISFVFSEGNVYLLTIYDKSEKENLADSELEDLLRFVHYGINAISISFMKTRTGLDITLNHFHQIKRVQHIISFYTSSYLLYLFIKALPKSKKPNDSL